jgi:hypothetical protein
MSLQLSTAVRKVIFKDDSVNTEELDRYETKADIKRLEGDILGLDGYLISLVYLDRKDKKENKREILIDTILLIDKDFKTLDTDTIKNMFKDIGLNREKFIETIRSFFDNPDEINLIDNAASLFE